ncbi:helix-turn-helix domain-containing protein [Chryseobacterium tongliaoense]|uniref:helix-turn-helix domain-containing protein n=1 Tax=Chryseobacterium tongliaoense TaxID=3240933 RepID=UPI00351416BC
MIKKTLKMKNNCISIETYPKDDYQYVPITFTSKLNFYPLKMKGPNYRQIYSDIILEQFPDKMDLCRNILSKSHLSTLDVIKLNDILWKQNKTINYRGKSYDKKSIFKMLEFQKENKLNNTQLAAHFNLSRNTVASWKKRFLITKELNNGF